MKKQFDIRLYQKGDAPVMIDLFRNSVRKVALKDYTSEQTRVWAPDDINAVEWEQRCLSRPTWLAFDQGILAGFIDLESDGHLDVLYVSSDHQGVGVASGLYACVEAQALRNGNKTIYVEASLTAKPFFERKGFRVLTAQDVERGGLVLVNFKMEKFL
ncbi:MAG: GNAT family N-acetyltransferase [Methylocystaceae bacterium]|nr:GNAT family N-acetyltransferase [Methylocystaceae bacterium]